MGSSGRASIPLAVPPLGDFVNGRIILGCSIGFDLAVLSAEAKRHGLEWHWPEGLCLRQLAALLIGRDSSLMDADLEGLAMHFGVPTKARHTAHGDATMGVVIFEKMSLALATKSIINLADVRRTMSQLNDLRIATVQAGWVDVAADGSEPIHYGHWRGLNPTPINIAFVTLCWIRR